MAAGDDLWMSTLRIAARRYRLCVPLAYRTGESMKFTRFAENHVMTQDMACCVDWRGRSRPDMSATLMEGFIV